MVIRMPALSNLAAAHAKRALADPDAPALVFPDQTLGHDLIRRPGLAFAARMRAAGIGPGSRVQLRTPDPVLVLAVLPGSAWVGASSSRLPVTMRPPPRWR